MANLGRGVSPLECIFLFFLSSLVTFIGVSPALELRLKDDGVELVLGAHHHVENRNEDSQ